MIKEADKLALAPAEKPPAMLSDCMSVEDVVKHMDLMKEAMKRVMLKNEDYRSFGVDPETGKEKKPSLQKPGAEKLCVLFRLSPSFETSEVYDGQHLTVKSRCTLSHINTGKIVGSGNGMCSTKEKKYAKRKYQGKYIDNNELPDLYNTVVKMADKRALVAAVLVATAASAMFTQDMGEDETPEEHPDEKKPTSHSPAPAKEIEVKAEVKEAPKEPLVVPDAAPIWIGRIKTVEACQTPKGTKKYLFLSGEDKTAFIVQQPPESDKAGMDIYLMLKRDLEGYVKDGKELTITYTVSPSTGNKLVCSVKVAEPSPLADGVPV